MKILKTRVFLVSAVFLSLIIRTSSFATPETRPQSIPAESSPRPSQSLLQQAVTLLEIYGKIKRLINADEQDGLQTELDRLNGILDQLLDFKGSLTPQKKARIEEQLNRVKQDVKGFKDIEARQIRKQFSKLSDSLITLVNIIMDTAPENRI